MTVTQEQMVKFTILGLALRDLSAEDLAAWEDDCLAAVGTAPTPAIREAAEVTLRVARLMGEARRLIETAGGVAHQALHDVMEQEARDAGTVERLRLVTEDL